MSDASNDRTGEDESRRLREELLGAVDRLTRECEASTSGSSREGRPERERLVMVARMRGAVAGCHLTISALSSDTGGGPHRGRAVASSAIRLADELIVRASGLDEERVPF